jgi:shikimate dehydrogenase
MRKAEALKGKVSKRSGRSEREGDMTTALQRYAIIGNPLGHSLSPLMHNTAYRAMGMNASYEALETPDLQEAIATIRERDVRGVSVTIPFKESVLAHLDEVDPDALRIGSVNTLTSRNGRLLGSNTDWPGLRRDLRGRWEIRGNTVAILGAGGAARAAVYAIQQEGGMPVIVNRTGSRGETLAEQFGCASLPLSEIGSLRAAGLINTTSVGMMPRADESPVPARLLSRFRWVADIVYNPPLTRLLAEASTAGCETITGIGMFVNQGAEQIRIWTGRPPPRQLMRRVVEEALKNGSQRGRLPLRRQD